MTDIFFAETILFSFVTSLSPLHLGNQSNRHFETRVATEIKPRKFGENRRAGAKTLWERNPSNHLLEKSPSGQWQQNQLVGLTRKSVITLPDSLRFSMGSGQTTMKWVSDESPMALALYGPSLPPLVAAESGESVRGSEENTQQPKETKTNGQRSVVVLTLAPIVLRSEESERKERGNGANHLSCGVDLARINLGKWAPKTGSEWVDEWVSEGVSVASKKLPPRKLMTR